MKAMCLLHKKWLLIFKHSKAGVALLFWISAGCGFITNPPSFISGDSFSIEEEDDNFAEEGLQRLSEHSLKKVGIFFVVDTSYSMVRHLQRVPKTFKNFIPILEPLDWQIMFTNADYNPDRISAYYNSNLFMGRAMKLEWNNHILPNKILYSHSEEKEQIFLDTLKRYEQSDNPQSNAHSYINPCELPPFAKAV